MGKIYDALEKSHKEKRRSAELSKGSVVDFYKQPGKDTEIIDLLEPLNLYDNVDKNLVTFLNRSLHLYPLSHTFSPLI